LDLLDNQPGCPTSPIYYGKIILSIFLYIYFYILLLFLLLFFTAVRFNHKKPSRMSWGEKILGGGGLGVHNSRIEPFERRVVFIICTI
jgi:hypothetical protein